MSKNSPSLRQGGQTKSVGNFKIATGAVICSEAQLSGDITVGTRTVIHPTAKVIAEGGPIVIGSNNLIMEKSVIHNKKRDDGVSTTMVIGDGNVFEFSSNCESLSVGNENVLEAKSHVGGGVSITERCVIGAYCTVDSEGETLPPGTVITGKEHTRWRRGATTQTTNAQQLEVLVKLLPNFHKLIKSTS